LTQGCKANPGLEFAIAFSDGMHGLEFANAFSDGTSGWNLRSLSAMERWNCKWKEF